jgi:hypothetical protein
MNMNVEYVKVTIDSEEVKVLAAKLNVTATSIVSMINNQRYRTAYNKIRNQQMKVVKEMLKKSGLTVEQLATQLNREGE